MPSSCGMFNLCTIGYFICELVPVPKFLSGISESASIYSVSSCIGKQHPCLSGCFWAGHRKKKKSYQKRMGWDNNFFHTFLCNSIQTRLSDAKFNEHGLLSNSYEEVEEFAKKIEGMGEPAIWLPYKLALCENRQ